MKRRVFLKMAALIPAAAIAKPSQVSGLIPIDHAADASAWSIEGATLDLYADTPDRLAYWSDANTLTFDAPTISYVGIMVGGVPYKLLCEIEEELHGLD